MNENEDKTSKMPESIWASVRVSSITNMATWDTVKQVEEEGSYYVRTDLHQAELDAMRKLIKELVFEVDLLSLGLEFATDYQKDLLARAYKIMNATLPDPLREVQK